MRRIVVNPVSYVLLYLVCMLPTYILPYMGSNAHATRALGNAVASAYGAQSHSFAGPFYAHLLFLVVLIALSYFRGVEIAKTWIVIFPVLAAFFDMMPGFNLIPLAPTVFHMLAIVFGVAGVTTKVASPSSIQPG
jgi:hypothetical protein